MQAIMTLNDAHAPKMDLLSRNTMKVAQFLSKHPQVESVSTWVCRSIRYTSWPASTCGWWTPSTTNSTANR